MKDIWVISDTHFGDVDFYTYKLQDGSPARPFNNSVEADECMVENWNNVVKPQDKIYILGDLGVKKTLREILPKLNGKKCLIKGNHDDEKINFYKEYFYDVRAYHVMDKILFAHIPVHPYCKARFLLQAHGHTHTFVFPDKFYQNMCVEKNNYTPVNYDTLLDLSKKYVRDIDIDTIWDECYNNKNKIEV